MMYCAVEEAYDGPFKQQIRELDKINNIKKQRSSLVQSVSDYQNRYGLDPPHTNNNNYDHATGYLPTMINNENNNNEEELAGEEEDNNYFTAQGDLTKNNYGTSISELRKKEDDSLFDDDMSILDSNYSEASKISKHKVSKNDTFNNNNTNNNNTNNNNKINFGHKYYISKFIRSMLNDGNDTLSLESSQDDGMYEHIKTCKYCRNQINMKMRMYYNTPNNKKIEGMVNIEKNQDKSNNTNFKLNDLKLPEDFFGYNIK
jgi:hypothetical protein